MASIILYSNRFNFHRCSCIHRFGAICIVKVVLMFYSKDIAIFFMLDTVKTDDSFIFASAKLRIKVKL